VCGGDGLSCPELCKEIDNGPAKKLIRREAKRMVVSTLNRIKRELQCDRKSPSARARVTELRAKRKQLEELLSIISETVKLCDTPFCQKTSFAELHTEIESTLKRIVRIDKLSQRAALRACGGGGTGTPSRKRKFKQYISELPIEQCD